MFESRQELYTFLAIFIISAAPFLYFYNANQGLWWDEAVYLGLAKNIYEGKGYWISSPSQESFRPPLFPFLTYLLWLSFGISESLVKIIPPLFGIFSVVLLYFFARRLFGRETAFFSSLTLATSYMFLFYGIKFLTETMFIFLGIAGLYSYYIGTEGKKWYLPLSGILFALSFLTRYAGGLYMILYVMYPVIKHRDKKKIFQDFKNPYFLMGVSLFFVCLIPWFVLNQMNFSSPTASLFVGVEKVSGYYIADWYFYFINWFDIFGMIGIFALTGAYFLLSKRNNPKNLILFLIIASIILFMLIPRKETRYLLHFFQIYSILIAIGITEFKKLVKPSWLVPAIAIILAISNLYIGIQMIQSGLQSSVGLREAGIWLSDRVPPNSKIMSNDYPYLYYFTGKEVVPFPPEEKTFQDSLSNNIYYIVLNSQEPTYPAYVWRGDSEKVPAIDNRFILENTFQEYNKTYIWVYRVSK